MQQIHTLIWLIKKLHEDFILNLQKVFQTIIKFFIRNG